MIDTDAPVPAIVSRLRVDLYDEGGGWYASHDFDLPSGTDWPASFAVYVPDSTSRAVVTVRLRAYREGGVRDYRGERFAPRADASGNPQDTISPPDPPADQGPRLVDADGNDATPATEPEPLAAIDRLLRVRIAPGEVQSARLVLRGACAGTMADIASGTTCVDTEASLVDVAPLPTAAPGPAAASIAGTFGAAPCTATPRARSTAPDGTPLFDEEVCAPGGAFVFGSAVSPGNPDDVAWWSPERVAVVEPLRIDAFEFTVARYRAAVRAGYAGSHEILENDVPIPPSAFSLTEELADSRYCTFSAQPMGRERMPLTCVSWTTARDLCRFFDGDLPTEAQWEWIASQAGRAAKTRFPWGDAAPGGCARAVYGRGMHSEDTVSYVPDVCVPLGFGPQAVDVAGREGEDATALGVFDMAGSVTEWTLDAAESRSSRCWMSAPLRMPWCDVPGAKWRIIRGGAWLTPSDGAITLFTYSRAFSPIVAGGGGNSGIGFRCARQGGS